MAHIKTLCKLPKRRNTIPVLSLAKFTDNTLITTDLDKYIYIPCPDMAHRMEPDTLYQPIGLENGLFIKAEIAAAYFPEMSDKGKLIGNIQFDGDYMPLLKWVLEAASTEAKRYYLNGVYFDPDGVIVATDGHRLHSFEKRIDYGKTKKKDRLGHIIPRDLMKAVFDLIKETKADAFTFYLYEKGVSVDIAGHTVEGKVIDGTFPQWRKVVPSLCRKTFFNPDEIKPVIAEAKILNKVHGTGSMIPLKFVGGKVVFEVPFKKEVVERSISTNFKKMEKGFQAKYIVAMPAGDMYYDESGGPVVIKSKNNIAPVTAVIMPLRV